MDDCISCCDKALYRCTPCTASFCEEHKELHEKNKHKVHTFETIGIKLDSRQTRKIVESLRLKINVLKSLKEKITLETSKLIRQIYELWTDCLENIESPYIPGLTRK